MAGRVSKFEVSSIRKKVEEMIKNAPMLCKIIFIPSDMKSKERRWKTIYVTTATTEDIMKNLKIFLLFFT